MCGCFPARPARCVDYTSIVKARSKTGYALSSSVAVGSGEYVPARGIIPQLLCVSAASPGMDSSFSDRLRRAAFRSDPSNGRCPQSRSGERM
jgi:hypothetical protein